MDLPTYDTVINNNQTVMKSIHCFMNPVVTVVSGTSDQEFTVSLADSQLFFVGSFIRVHSVDFTDNSTPGISDDDVTVESVDNLTGIITVNKSMGFTPGSGYLVDLIGFKIDEGSPYRFF